MRMRLAIVIAMAIAIAMAIGMNRENSVPCASAKDRSLEEGDGHGTLLSSSTKRADL